MTNSILLSTGRRMLKIQAQALNVFNYAEISDRHIGGSAFSLRLQLQAGGKLRGSGGVTRPAIPAPSSVSMIDGTSLSHLFTA